MSSILTSVKKTLGLAEDDDTFDVDVILHINSVFSMLEQLGVGPKGGFLIESSDTTWTEYLAEETKFNMVRSYMALRVRMLFDPPQTSFLTAAIEKQITEFEWRLNAAREDEEWVDPRPIKVLTES